jgi:hypothetical protein
MKPLRFAILGTGFWSRYQLAAWRELKGVECVALYNRTRAKAEALNREFGISAIHDDPEELLEREQLDFVDIITDVGTHAPFTRLAASYAARTHARNGTSEGDDLCPPCESLRVSAFHRRNHLLRRHDRQHPPRRADADDTPSAPARRLNGTRGGVTPFSG